MSKIFGYVFFVGLLCLSFGSFAQVNLNQGLIAWYPFSGNAGDSSGNGHNGIIKDATLTKDRFGNDNSAYYCDGVNKAITVLGLGDYKAAGVSISVWIKTTYSGSTVELVKGAIGTLYLNVFKTGTFLADFDGTMKHSSKALVSDSIVTTGNWVNLTATNDGTTTRLYVNGQLQKSYPEKLLTGGSDFVIANKNFAGSIDDVRVYSRALSAAEVQAIYNLTH
jgi:hypothetical protein